MKKLLYAVAGLAVLAMPTSMATGFFNNSRSNHTLSTTDTVLGKIKNTNIMIAYNKNQK